MLNIKTRLIAAALIGTCALPVGGFAAPLSAPAQAARGETALIQLAQLRDERREVRRERRDLRDERRDYRRALRRGDADDIRAESRDVRRARRDVRDARRELRQERRYYVRNGRRYYRDVSGAEIFAGLVTGAIAAGAAAAAAQSDAAAVAYCERRFRSYDPASGTYLGYDGLRHPCP